MKTFVLRYRNEVLVAAVAAFLLFSAVVTVTLAPLMAEAAGDIGRPAATAASNVRATTVRGLL